MITTFRDKTIIAFFALTITTLLVHLHIFNTPVVIVTNTESGAFSWVLKTYISRLQPQVISLLFIVVLFVQAIRLNTILNDSKMFAKTTFTTAFAYIFLSGLLINAFSFSAAFLANSFIILLFATLLKLYNNSNAKALLFNVGFLASALVICFYPSVIIVPLVFFGLAILRPFKIVEWFILLMGIVAPFYLTFGIMYLCNFNFGNIILPKILFYIRFQQNNVWYFINFFSIIVLLIAALLTWYPNSNRLVIQIRKNWVVMLILLVLSATTIPMFTKANFLPEVICLVPLAAFLSNLFFYPKKTILLNILIFIIAIVIVYNNSLLWK